MATPIINALSGGLLEGVSHVIDSIKGKSPGDAAKLQELTLQYKEAFEEAQSRLEEKRIDADTQRDTTAGENIRAEITSPDSVVRRARSLPLWTGGAVLFLNYCLLPVVHIWRAFQPLALPDMFWYTYMFAIGGYVGHSLIDRATGGAGGSVSFLGMKVESKGD